MTSSSPSFPFGQVAIFFGLIVGFAAIAQEPNPKPVDPNGLTAERLHQQIASTKAAPIASEENRAEILKTLEAALRHIQRRDAQVRELDSLRKRMAQAPTDLEHADLALKNLARAPAPVSTTDLAELRALRSTMETELRQSREKLEELQARLSRRPKQLAEMPQRISQLADEVRQMESIVAPPAAEDIPELAEARTADRSANMAAAAATLETLKAEKLLLESTGDLLTRQVEVQTRQSNRLETQLADINNLIDAEEDRHQKELARKALIAAASEDPRIQAVIAENRLIAERFNNSKLFQEYVQKAKERLADSLAKLKQLDEDVERTKRRLQVGGSNEVIGTMMRGTRENLPDTAVLRRRLVWTAATAKETAIEKIELDERLQKLIDIEKAVRDTLGPGNESSHERLAQAETLRGHLQIKRDLFQAAAQAYEELLNDLTELDSTTRKLLTKVEEMDAFIAERILWLRSTSPIATAEIPHLWEAVGDLIDPHRWIAAWSVLQKDFLKVPLLYIGALVPILGAILFRRRLRRTIRDAGARVTKNYVATPQLTLVTLLMTIVTAGAGPLGLAMIGHRLTDPNVAWKIEVVAIGRALEFTALLLFVIGFWRQICRPSGLATTHFRWRAQTTSVLRKNLFLLAMILLPLSFTMTMLRVDVSTPARTAMVRVLFMASMGVLAIFFYRTFGTRHQVAEVLLAAGPTSNLVRLRKVWFFSLVGLPLALAVMAAIGYLDTASLFSNRLLATLALAAGVVVVNALILRWLYAVRGQLALAQARKRRDSEGNEGGEGKQDDQFIDLSTINSQTRRFLSLGVTLAFILGMVFIWSDIVPAFRALERVQFWSKTEYSWETRQDPTTGTTALERIERTRPVTLGTFAVVLLIGFVTAAAAKNLPGLLEVTLLARLPLDGGTRFAISTVARYAITIVGLITVSNRLGIRWDSVQWLAAAFTVGLGFGLQEIVANFVSGLILLAERPIRIGDIVTVGELHGSVTRIQMRATTITDGDRKELIVPNKEFITGKFVNWTLTDRILRVSIPVSVAYGSDTAKTAAILEQIARRQPFVLADPAPRAVFDRFGETSLHFTVQVFVDNVDHSQITKHQLHMQIYEDLARAGIEIAYPSREVNVRFVPETVPVIERLTRPLDEPKRASA